MKKPWEEIPDLPHLSKLGKSEYVEQLKLRKRLKDIRYKLFRMQASELKNKKPDIELPVGFLEHWLKQKPQYKLNMQSANKNTPGAIQQQPGVYVVLVPGEVPKDLQHSTVTNLGGVATFAITWDVDPQLRIFLRRASVWHEWDMKLRQIAPRLDTKV